MNRQIYERIRNTLEDITNNDVYVHTLPPGRKLFMLTKYKYNVVVDVFRDQNNPNIYNIIMSFGNIRKIKFKWYENLKRFTPGYTYEIVRAIKYVRNRLRQFNTYVSFDIGAKNIFESLIFDKNKTDENMLQLFVTENYLIQSSARPVIMAIHYKLAKAVQNKDQNEIINQIKNLFGFIEKTIKEYYYPEIKKHLYYFEKYVINNLDDIRKTLFIIPTQKYVDYPTSYDSKLFRMIESGEYNNSSNCLDILDAFVFGRTIYLGILMLTKYLDGIGAKYFFIDEFNTSNTLFDIYPVVRQENKYKLRIDNVIMSVEKNNISCLNHIYYVAPEIKDKTLIKHQDKWYLVRYTKLIQIPFINMLTDKDRKEINVDIDLDIFNAETWIKLYHRYKNSLRDN